MEDDLQIPTLSFDDTPEEPAETPALSFVPEVIKPNLPDHIVQLRAAKADFALQKMSPGFDALKDGIDSGKEPEMRLDHATQVDMEKHAQALGVVQEVAGKVGRPLIPEEIDTVLRTAQGAREPTDPATLWEKLYAVHYVKAFTTDDPEHNFIFGKAMEKEPAEAIATLDKGSNTQAWKEIVATKYQDLEARWNNEISLFGQAGIVIAGALTGGLIENFWLHDAIREAVPATDTILPGRNLLQQMQWLNMLPVDKRKVIMERVADELFEMHPPAAFKFLKAANDYASSDIMAHDLMGVVDPILLFLPYGTGAKAPPEPKLWRQMTPDELGVMRASMPKVKEIAREGMTANTPRPMTIRELMAARDGLQIEGPTGLLTAGFNTGISKGSTTVKVPGRNMTPEELARAKEGAPKSEGPVTTVTVNGQQYKPTKDTVYVDPTELDTKMATSGDNQRRLFRDSEGHLAISERRAEAGRSGAWRPTGARITTYDEPEMGMVALNLGPARNSRGSAYFDNYRVDGRVEAVQKVGTVTEPRPMNMQEIMRAREGVPGRLMDQSEVQLLRNATAQAIQAYNPLQPLDAVAMAAAMGNIPSAAAQLATRMIMNRFVDVDPLKEGTEFVKNIPSIMQGKEFFHKQSRSLSLAQANTLANDAVKLNSTLFNALVNPTRAPRLDRPALEEAVKIAAEKWKKEAYFKSDGLLEHEHIPANNITNVDYVSFNFGRHTRELFDTPQQAEHWAKEIYKFHDGDWLVRQKGNKFMVSVPRPIDETDPRVFAKMIVTKHTETPQGLANMLFGYLRNSEDVLSEFNRKTRHIITHSPNELKAVLQEAASQISDLKSPINSKALRELEEILIENQKTRGADGVPGVFYRDVAAFEEAFLRRFNKLPSPSQVKGYDTYVRLNEFDGMLRVLGWHRDMSRMGVVNYRFGVPTEKAGLVKTDFIPGRPSEINYSGTADEGILFIDARSGTHQYVTKFKLKDEEKALRKDIDNLIKNEGYQVIQLFAPTKKPLASVTGENNVIHYVVTKGVEHKRLMWGQGVDWRPGGHLIYQDLYFAKQPIIATGAKGIETYFGDATIRAAGNSEREANALVAKYEAARLLLKAGDDAALDTFLRKNLPESLADFKKLFTGAGPGGGLSIDHPIVATYTGRNTFETNSILAKEERYRGLREQATHPSNLEAALDKKFLAERGPILSRVAAKGTESNPIFSLEQARLVDPFTALNMSLGNAIRSRFFTDYKQSVAAHWVSEFKDVMKNGMRDADILERNPVYALYHREIDKAVVNRERASAAESMRKRALMLLGTQSEMGAALNRVEQTVMNKVYDVFGEKGTKWVVDHPNVLAAIKDPANYMRAVAFHTKLGFFNPVQLMVQAQTMFHAMAIAPTHAMPGMSAWYASTRLRFTESDEILNYVASRLPGWKPDEFKEAYTTMKNTGISHVGGETSWRDDMFDPRIFRSAIGGWLDKGTIFFREGERATREAAWFIAYKEWRKANPTAVLDQANVGTILNRWQTMTGDMTRAANAGWQQGALTIPTQFLTFNIRMMEQLLPGLSSRLTATEKFRVIATYSALYGVPIGASTATGFIPFYDDMRKYAIENQKDVHDNYFKLWHEGLMSTMLSWVTGRDYDVPQRLGPGANNLFSEIIKGNKGVIETIVGPSGGAMWDILGTTVPFFRWAYYGAMGGDDQKYPITIEDFKSILQSENISTLKHAGRMLVGLNIGKYMDKHEGYVGDVTTMDSIFMGLGFTPMQIRDAQFGAVILREEKKVKEKFTHEIVAEIRRGVDASAKNDDEKANRHFTRARALTQAGGLNWTDYNRAFSLALTGYESQADRVNRRMLTTGDPDRQRRIMNQGQQ